MLPYFWNRKKPLNALVSLHRDGRMIAGLLEKFGLGTIGGSSNASGAAVKLMHSLKDDTAICIIPDGPRGPRMHMGRSPLYYAQKTGKPIACISYSIANSFRITKSWDHMMIPLPFSRGICTVSEAMSVPADADNNELETYRLRLEEQLNRISRECDIKMGLIPDEPGICKNQTEENGQPR